MQYIISATSLKKDFRVRGNKNLFTGLFKPDYRTIKAVDDISFEVNEGEAVALLGPNGAGKTTTAKMLTGLMYPSAGAVKVLGHVPFERKSTFLSQIGLVMGNRAGLNWDLTARQSLDLLGRIYEIPNKVLRKRLGDLTTMLSVDGQLDTQIRRLSLGERMKLEVVGSIIHKPKVLFLDEPTIGLDSLSSKALREFLVHMQDHEKTTLVFTSHNMDDVEHVCERVIVINHGKLVVDEPLRKLMREHADTKRIEISYESPVEIENINELSYLPVEQLPGRLVFEVLREEVAGVVGAAARFGSISDVHVEAKDLETIIADMYRPEVKKSN